MSAARSGPPPGVSRLRRTANACLQERTDEDLVTFLRTRREAGLGYEEIAQDLFLAAGVRVSYQTIKRWLAYFGITTATTDPPGLFSESDQPRAS